MLGGEGINWSGVVSWGLWGECCSGGGLGGCPSEWSELACTASGRWLGLFVVMLSSWWGQGGESGERDE